MSSRHTLQALEARISDLEAILDGSEAQTRDATVYLVGIVTRFLHEKGLIDEGALKDYVRTFEGDATDRDDYLGDFVRQFGSMLGFHQRYPRDFLLAGSGSAGGPDMDGR